MAELFRNAAFISYSSVDAAFARRLHRTLEAYHIPRALGAFDLIGGGKKNRIYPVCIDREELPAGDLGELIEAALRASANLIVVCSPNSAASPWVQKEIEYFAGLGRQDRIFAIIADDAPLTDDSGADATGKSFPPAFSGDTLADGAIEPLAADARKGKDGFRNAWLKIVAGLIGKSPGDLIDRDKRRRRGRRLAIAGAAAAAVVTLFLTGAWIDARAWRVEMTAHAANLTGRSLPLDAASFAVAGLPERSNLLATPRREADDAARSAGLSVPVTADFGSANFLGFSGDDRFVLTRDEEGICYLHTLDGPRVPPRALGMTGRFQFSLDGRYLLRQNEWSILFLHDLVAGGAPKRSPGPQLNFAFSPDSRFLLTRDFPPEHNAYLYDLFLDPAFGTPHALGSAAGNFLFSHDSRFVVIRDSERHATLHNLGSLGAPPHPLGRLSQFEFSNDGRFLLAVDPELEGSLIELDNLEAAPRRLGRLVHAGFSGDGRLLLTQDYYGNPAQLRDPANLNATPRVLDVLQSFGFSNDGRFLLTTSTGADGLPDDSALYDLRPRGESRRVAEVDRFGFSGDSRYLATQNRERAAFLHDLSRLSAPPQSLGPVESISEESFSSSSRYLVTVEPNGAAALRDLRVPFAQGRGASLRKNVCAASGDALRPFPRVHRRRGAVLSQRASDALRGRPWNPCDWRGLLAIFPNAERGDAWFEGLRQWWRLFRVRRGWADEYECWESTAGTPALMERGNRTAIARDRARRDMCDRFGREA